MRENRLPLLCVRFLAQSHGGLQALYIPENQNYKAQKTGFETLYISDTFLKSEANYTTNSRL
jgi:hypothetical protein